jgi:hypothetical protein
MDGVMEYESPAHAPRLPYRLGIHGTVWRFRLIVTIDPPPHPTHLQSHMCTVPS